MPLKVRRLPRARRDKLEIWVHIASSSLGAADKLADRLDAAVELLADYPQAGAARPQLGKGIRSFPVVPFILFYRAAPGRLEVVRILHSARDVTADMLVQD